MANKLGEQIKKLRKSRGISQEALARLLGVSFQAVSKWETGVTMPDISLVPAMASFFGVSTDELFDYNTLKNERKIEEICRSAAKIMRDDPARAEILLRDGLTQYPANEQLLTVLLYTLRLIPGRESDVIEVCDTLIEYGKIEGVKCDVYKILAETYAATGRQEKVEAVLDQIPEFYFTKMECAAKLLTGEASMQAAQFQMNLSANTTVEMLKIMADHKESQGAADAAEACRRIALGVLEVYRQEKGTDFEVPGYQWIDRQYSTLQG